MTNEVIIGVVIVVAFYLLSSKLKRFRNINHHQRKQIVEEQG